MGAGACGGKKAGAACGGVRPAGPCGARALAGGALKLWTGPGPWSPMQMTVQAGLYVAGPCADHG
jgi:hypothetical protein